MLGWLLMLSSSILVQPSGVTEAAAPADRTAQFSYDATEAKNRRKAPLVNTRSEDQILDTGRRAKLTANSRDIQRNFAIAAWMIRRHLDYVATFQFHARTEDEAFNDLWEQKIARWSQKDRCDAARRHSLDRILRMLEQRAIIDGDCGVLKLADGHVQGIEADRIKNPAGKDAGEEWVHGIKTDKAGGALAYAIHRRTKGGSLELERIVPAGNLCLHGYFDRFDQFRGVSPIVTALNPLRDVYENFDLALLKAKVTQLFALVFQRKAAAAAGDIEGGIDELGNQKKGAYTADFGNGPVLLDLEPGDDAKFLESQHPSSQFQDFTQLVIMVALKALDIPFSFYDESHTNFFGSRGAWLHYERSCKNKRDNLGAVMRGLIQWRTMLLILDGELTLPAGETLETIPFECVPLGMPWWDPSKELNGDVQAIQAGLDNPQRICKERGRGDFYENVLQIKKALDFAAQHGVTLSFTPLQPVVEVVERDDA